MCLKIDVGKSRAKMAVCRLSLKLAWQTDWNDTHQNNFLQYFQINIFTTSVFWNQYFLSLSTSTNIQMAGFRCIPRYRCQRSSISFCVAFHVWSPKDWKSQILRDNNWQMLSSDFSRARKYSTADMRDSQSLVGGRLEIENTPRPPKYLFSQMFTVDICNNC